MTIGDLSFAYSRTNKAMNRKELFVAPKQVGALTVIPCIMTIKSVNFLMGGLALFAAQGCKSPKQVAEQAEHPNII